jgi:hypothetical protein
MSETYGSCGLLGGRCLLLGSLLLDLGLSLLGSGGSDRLSLLLSKLYWSRATYTTR